MSEEKRLLSPSQINTYLSCPRQWFYRYILEIPEEPQFAQVRGKVVHSVVEEIFQWRPPAGLKYDDLITALREKALKLLKKYWEEEEIESIWGNDRFEETKGMIEKFVTLHKWRMDPLYEKYKDTSKAWNFTKPKFTEFHIKDDELGMHGYIDAVIDRGDGEIVLVDYKTSTIFKHPVSKEYERQLMMYALLYYRQTGIFPKYVSLHFLLYGMVSNFPVRSEFLDETKDLIHAVRSKLRFNDIEHYPINEEFRFCKWCGFYQVVCEGGGKDKKELM